MASTRPDERGAEAPAVKASTFDLTPTGPLGAGSLLSPLSTTSPRKQAWEATARSWSSRHASGAFGSVAPGPKTSAGERPEDTARGGGPLAYRTVSPRVIDAETILASLAAAAAKAGAPSAFVGGTPSSSRAEWTTPGGSAAAASSLLPTARALDFDARVEALRERARAARQPNPSPEPSPSATVAKDDAPDASSSRERARDALLAFLDAKARLRLSRRTARDAFTRWREATPCREREYAAETIAVDVAAVETMMPVSVHEWWRARAALRCWRLIAQLSRAESNAPDDGSRRPLRGVRAVRASKWRPAGAASPPDSPVRAYDASHPMYGKMDAKLARWLETDDACDGEGDGVDALLGSPRRGLSSSPPPSWETYRASAPATEPRLEAMETLVAAHREAGSRVAALEAANRALEADLFAAAQLWEETERENETLRAEARARGDERNDAEWRDRPRGGRRAEVRAEALEYDPPPRDPRRGNGDGASVRSEVEELEACAAEMRRRLGGKRGGGFRGERYF